MEKFDTLFGIKLGCTLFSASESLSKSLQSKNITFQEALAAVNLCKDFYPKQREEEALNCLNDKVVKCGQDLEINVPSLPRYRRAPARIEDVSSPHKYSMPRNIM